MNAPILFAQNGSGEQGLAIVVLLVVVGLYFVPTFIAFSRHHRNAGAILALNLLLGWSVIGWVAALVWSLTVDQQTIIVPQNFDDPTRPYSRVELKKEVDPRSLREKKEDAYHTWLGALVFLVLMGALGLGFNTMAERGVLPGILLGGLIAAGGFGVILLVSKGTGK